MIIADQIRAARALLGWSQSELSKKTGLSTPAIGNIEIEKHKPTLDTQAKIVRAFEEAGVEFIDEGVRRKRDKIRIIEGDDAFLKLLDDIYYTIQDCDNKEVLVIFADEKETPKEAFEKMKMIKAIGGKFRFILEEGDNHIMGALNEYRWMPTRYFINQVSVVYGEKTAFITGTPDFLITVISDPALKRAQKNAFEYFWANLKQPTWSSAEVRFEN